MYLILQNKQGTGIVNPPDWSGTSTQTKVLASDGAASDLFGVSVSLSSDGNTAIIGAYGDDDGGDSAGSAYIFTQSGGVWSQHQKLLASDGLLGDQFGYSVSISSDGNTAIVGAWTEDTNGSVAGAAYVFTQSGGVWTQQQKLLASGGVAGDHFGNSVSISTDGNTAIVGAYYESTLGSTAGAAYVFTRSGGVWTQQQKLLASDGAAAHRFGKSVSLSSDGNTTIIGAYQNTNANGSYAGAAYVFTRSGGIWTEHQQLIASDGAANDLFGWSVSISGDGNTAIAGAYKADSPGSDAGAAYIFTQSGGVWTQQQKILPTVTSGYFGSSVSLSSDGNNAIVGAYYDDDKGTNAGAAYAFARSGSVWSQQQKLLASDGLGSDLLGWSVAISGDGHTAITSAHGSDTNGSSAGAAYIFNAQ